MKIHQYKWKKHKLFKWMFVKSDVRGPETGEIHEHAAAHTRLAAVVPAKKDVRTKAAKVKPIAGKEAMVEAKAK